MTEKQNLNAENHLQIAEGNNNPWLESRERGIAFWIPGD